MKNLFRKLERNLRHIERSPDLVATLHQIVRRLVDDFQDDLGLVGGRIYVRDGEHYALQRAYPARKLPEGFRIPVTYPPLRELLDLGFVYQRVGDPGVSREIESAIGVETFAAIAVGEEREHIVAFTVKKGSEPERVGHTLNTLRHVINLKLRQEYFTDRLEQAREIQLSLLPPAPPSYGDFDLWAASVPAEEVGGDLYDFIPVSGRSLGIAVADASGHGLPAALQARDAIIGLRMGVEERLRITATLEKLNKVIHRSALASKFISVFYAELEINGTLVYCNAGHPAPILWDGHAFEALSRGGIVLGPDRDALYERGYVSVRPGSVLLAYTDGITEAENTRGESFGEARLRKLVRKQPWPSAKALVEAIFQAVRSFSGKRQPEDDQTVVAVLRRA